MTDGPAGAVRSHLRAAQSACGRSTIAMLVLLQALAAVSEGLALILLVPVVEVIASDGVPRLPMAGATTPPYAFAALATAVLLRAAAQWAAAVRGNELRMQTIDTVRLAALSAVLDADWKFVTSRRRSHLVQQLTSEVLRAGAALDLLTRILVGSLVLVATAVAAIALAPLPGVLAVVTVAAMTLLARGTLGRAAELGVSLSDRVAAFGAAVTDSLASVRLIRAHEAAGPWTRAVADEAAQSRAVQRSYVRQSAGLRAALGVAGSGAAVTLVLLGRELGLDPAQLVVLAVAATRLLTTAQTLVTQVQQFSHLAPALTQISALTDDARRHREHADTVSHPAGMQLHDHTGTTPLVMLRQVTVRHDPARPPALDRIDLALPRQGLTVLAGPSGAGKSTLLDVLLGLLRPDSGIVLVDGSPLADVRRWRSRVGYVPQEVVLVPGTVLANLTWSAGREVSEDEAWATLETACVAETVRALPQGLRTPLRESAELSGGEQQRLSLARALVRRPELLLLDEATSALDPVTEAAVLKQISEANRAVLLVTHRAAPLDRADQVLHLVGGHLVIP